MIPWPSGETPIVVGRAATAESARPTQTSRAATPTIARRRPCRSGGETCGDVNIVRLLGVGLDRHRQGPPGRFHDPQRALTIQGALR